MNKENRNLLIFTIVAIILMFVWIFVAVYLTGGRDVTEFTDTDKTVFAGFIIAELLTVASVIINLNRVQKLSKKSEVNAQNTVKKSVDKRRVYISIAAFVAIMMAMFCGIFAKPAVNPSLENLIGFTCITALLLPILFLVINVIISRIYVKRLKKKAFIDEQEYWLSHRTDPEKTISKKLSLLKTIIIINDFYSTVLAVCALALAFCLGLVGDGGESVGVLFICYLVISGATLRIRLKPSEKIFEEDKTYVSENDYPVLYGLARKAATIIGCTQKIKIAIRDDFNAGAASINNTVSIQLGALLLNVLSEDEVYCVLLHEFSHIKNEAGREKINNYQWHICNIHNNIVTDVYSNITKHLFAFIDVYFNRQYQLYLYAASLTRESAADRAMAIHGNNEIAASSLVKIQYYDLYSWEKGTYDTPCDMELEKYDTDSLKNEVRKFKEAIQLNMQKWNDIINNEILARTASHPTIKMRIESLGVTAPKALFGESSEKYIADCEKAIQYISSLIAEQSESSYEEYRGHYYIEAKELVEKWESDGKRIIAEDYGDICDALRRLGRNTEALELCENAIKSLNDVESCYAYFIKGSYLLHSFDESGIDYIYKAIENNNNYINEGLETIGHFCCLTGQEHQLEIYRERAVGLIEKNKLHAEATVLNKKDNLAAESLPSGMLEDILAYITSRYADNIEKIYLVRKTITDDFFTSAFVLKITSETDNDTRYKILHKVFTYLDTCADWQFSLFDYEDVKNAKIEDITGSCVYKRET